MLNGAAPVSEQTLLGQSSLQLQELPLSTEATAVPAETTVSADDPVTWHDDGDPVVSVGPPHRSRSPRCVCAAGQFVVADRAAVGDPEQLAPDPLPERGAGQHRWDIETAPASGEVLGELFGQTGEEGVVSGRRSASKSRFHELEPGCEQGVIRELEETDPIVVGPGQHGSERGFEAGRNDSGGVCVRHWG